MGKKEQSYAKELKKSAMKYLKSYEKKYNTKTVSGIIYKKQKDFFFWMIVSLDYFENGYAIYGEIKAKPYYLDDLFWDIFEISENKNQPDSLRANGAYAAPSIKIDSIKIGIEDEVILEEVCDKLLNDFNIKIESFLRAVPDIKSYHQFTMRNYDYSNRELLFILLEIQQGNYSKALELIEGELAARNSGGFAAGDKNIYEFARDYCRKQLV